MELLELVLQYSQNLAVTVVFLFVSVLLFRDGFPWLSEVLERIIDRYIDLQYAQMDAQNKNDERIGNSLEQLVKLTNLIDKRSSQIEAMISLIVKERINHNDKN